MVDRHELGPLEMRVLGMLREEQPSAVAAVRERLAHEGTDLAYTTVMTVLSRLHRKGLARRTREGNRFVYTPARAAPKVVDGVFGRVRRALFAGDRTRPFLTLLEGERLSTDELKELRRLIDRKIRENEPK